MVTVNLRTKSPKAKIFKLPSTLDVDTKGTVKDLTAAISKATQLGSERIRLTLIDNTLLVPGTSLDKYDLQDNSIVYVKDLGYQIGWQTVFYVEYGGPLFIHLLFYYLQEPIYGKTFVHSATQKAVFYMVMLHFLKRELETMFVHRFSNDTMPLLNIFKNSGHYWVLSGFSLAYFCYGPTPRPDLPGYLFYGLIAFWAYSEISNFITHLILSSLRPKGTRVRKIPYGYGFNLVSCPNYFFEACAWLAVALLTRSWTATLFLIVSTVTMFLWSLKKEAQYKKEFGSKYPKNRKAMFPYIA
ncbi:3-oxo-5-alpha-steroid 4-dehydrogenase-domain-containing protein [Lipomyces orientalis]|uniref:3-oxo-5-alpha-steroid 4-dehydrogenase-domain-containing protein n=1 Tax=Lipomyces orientalis TaxID=1233043 RepID=A0ACC3TSJ2_9ASCO